MAAAMGNKKTVIRPSSAWRMVRTFVWTLAAAAAALLTGSAPAQGTAATAPAPTSAAFYYGVNPPLADLQAFDVAVVEPEFVRNPAARTRAAADGMHQLFAYVSLGEVQPSRPYYKQLPPGLLRGDNAAWGSRVIDQNAPGWRDFFLDKIIAPLWAQGWRGFFLDTLDSYQLFAKTDAERAVQTQAMIATLREFKRRYPEAKLILNRGFELLPEIAPLTYAVAAESLYRGYDAGRRSYGPVKDNDRAWLMGQMQTARERYHLPVIAIDYVDPQQGGARALARETAQKISADGFIPWVADGGLVSMGVSSVELVPRNVLVLLDVADGDDLHTTEAQRFLGIQLNHLGLRYEFRDLRRESLPTEPLAGRYAGVVTWFRSGTNHQRLGPWIGQRIKEGVPVAIFSAFGFQMTKLSAGMLGLTSFSAPVPEQLDVTHYDPELMGFETRPRVDRTQLENVRLSDPTAPVLLRMKDGRDNTYDAAAITPWGGFALAPFAITTAPVIDPPRWVLQPMLFLKRALRLPDMAVPDVTTEGGRRIQTSHLDGDGFPSKAEYPGSPFAVEVLQREIWDRYRFPVTVSVVEGELSPQGVYPQLSAQTTALARKMFTLPYIEPASHSFSHPFNWADAMHDTRTADITQMDGDASRTLEIPNYKFNLQREIKGSMDYINNTLLPPGKKAEVFLWTGNCVPPPEAIAQTYLDGYLNMNGGDTMITKSRNTWTDIAAQGVRKQGWYQVFAPNQDENVYTGNWTGPFYGFERAIESYELTGEPVRFKAVDIYYHFYAGTKPASVAALHKIHRWAQAQPFTRLYVSQYIRKVIDFENTSIARTVDGALVYRTGAHLRTLRLPPGTPDYDLSAPGIAGIAPGPSGRYLITSAAEVRLKPPAQPAAQALPMLLEAGGQVGDFQRSVNGNKVELRFSLLANGPSTFSVAGARSCSASADGAALPAGKSVSITGQSWFKNFTAKSAVHQYDIGSSTAKLATTRHLVLVQCTL
ncbi:bifunctional glycoside hydrolase 114/ polysaccharide deacetylase family protein [Herbaspirillum seropedicae]|uniref:bifunctional glycoside hydrolase 114/ polysaccharide deacetylase family protein n=1 Tax=Herbaspirillum seropedicae TaxID=964 RepID=UPI003D96E62C